MIDQSARLQVIEALERTLAGTITNWEFDDFWPESEDRLIRALKEHLWGFDDDVPKKILDVRKIPNVAPVFERCLAFLGSGQEYEWPEYDFHPKGMSYLKNLFDRRGEREKWEKFIAAGDFEAWPFIRIENRI